MEHRDHRQESHGVHVCNKCGWPFPNPHPSAKHRRAHKRVCGTIEGFKSVESEANTLLTLSDDDGDHKNSSPKVLEGSCNDKGVDGIRIKSKESEDEVFSDAVAEFLEGVGPNKSMGDALDSVSTSKMAAESEMNSSQTLKDREIHDLVPSSSSSSENRIVENSVVAESTVNQSEKEQERKINQQSVNFETAFGTPLSSFSTENQKVENLIVAETATDQSGNEQESKSNQEYVNPETDFGTPLSNSTTENGKVENSVVAETTINQSGTEQETKINREFVNLETSFGTGDSMITPNDHMNDLYPIEPETLVPAPQQKRNIDSVENVSQYSLPFPDRRYDEKKNEDFGLCENLAEIAASSGKIDNDKSEPVTKMEEAIGIPTKPTEHNGTLLSIAGDDMSIHSKTLPSVVVSDVEPIDLTQVTSDAGKEIESCSSNNLLGTNKIKEGNDDVHLPSVLSDLYVVDHPEAIVEDFKDHKEVKLTNCVVQDPRGEVSGLEDNFKDPVPEESYSTSQAEPFDLTSEVASFDANTVENRQKQETRGNKVLVDVETDGLKNSGQEVEEVPVQEADVIRIKGVLSENEKQDMSQTLSDAAIFGIDSVPLASFSPEVESVAPSTKNSLDDFSENATEVLSDEYSMAAPTGNQKNVDDNEVGIGVGVLLADDDNKAGACGRHSEDSGQVHLPADVHERDDNGVGEEDMAGVDYKKDPSEEMFSIETDTTTESTTTNSRGNECISVAEERADESPRKFSVTESTDSGKVDISLVSDTQQSVKEDNSGGAVHVASISEVNADDQSCHVRDVNSGQNSSDAHANKEANLLPVGNETVTGRSDTSQDGGVSQLVGDAVRITSETWQDDGAKVNIKPQLTSFLLDASVDASSRTDSLEGNWGSVSVLSTQSDLPAVVDGEVTLQARAEAGQTDSKKANAATERQHFDRSDLFEPPSFMTLVEPNGGGIQNSAASEIQTAQNRQQPNSASLQAGWFPSYTHVANDSPGRKKNEAIIAKVTNWSTGKPHTALKNLLDDAALENKRKSPTRKENLASMIQKDEKSTKNGSLDTAVDSVMRPKSPTSHLGNKEIANEWNSPARYPSDSRRERRKGRPYWAQFVCCSSVH